MAQAREGLPLLLALDQGTTSTRAILYEAATLAPLAVHQLEHTQIMPQAGCACSPELHLPASDKRKAGLSTTR
jgi:glycerol kinase